MLDFKRATASYTSYRDPYLGQQIGKSWMRYDPTENCFVLGNPSETSGYVPDPQPGVPKHKRHVRFPKALWKVKPFAKIYPDRIVLVDEVHSRFLEVFNIRRTASRTIKLSGSTYYYKDQVLNGEVPVVLKDGVLSAAPVKVRVVESEGRNEMNRMIQKIRRLLKVRTKIGAFASLTPGDLAGKIESNKSRWEIYDRPSEFLKLLNAVVEDDINTFYPILWLAHNGYSDSNIPITDADYWVHAYNKLTDRMREKMRVELGIVSYVEPTEEAKPS